MKEIKISQRSVYGNILLYPVCENAHLFARLINKKTFTNADLGLIEQLGFLIVTVNQAVVS